MPEIPRVVQTLVGHSLAHSLKFALRCTLCLTLTALNGAVISFSGVPLYNAALGSPLQFAAVFLLFGALFGSLVRVWFIVLRVPAR